MGTTRKTITVTDQQDSWIKAQIAAGEFTNDSEYICDLIRRDQSSKAEIEAIRAGLIRAEQSIEQYGYSEKTPQERLSGFKEKARQNGKL